MNRYIQNTCCQSRFNVKYHIEKLKLAKRIITLDKKVTDAMKNDSNKQSKSCQGHNQGLSCVSGLFCNLFPSMMLTFTPV